MTAPAPLGDAELAELTEALGKMTPGPWSVRTGVYSFAECDDTEPWACIEAPRHPSAPAHRGATGIASVEEDGLRPDAQDANANGIVALRNAAPALLATIAAQSERIAELEAQVDALDKAVNYALGAMLDPSTPRRMMAMTDVSEMVHAAFDTPADEAP